MSRVSVTVRVEIADEFDGPISSHERTVLPTAPGNPQWFSEHAAAGMAEAAADVIASIEAVHGHMVRAQTPNRDRLARRSTNGGSGG